MHTSISALAPILVAFTWLDNDTSWRTHGFYEAVKIDECHVYQKMGEIDSIPEIQPN